jgi:glutamate dehydrogenase/leucine dehydrogenase
MCRRGSNITKVKTSRPAFQMSKLLRDYAVLIGKRPWTLVESVDIALPCATQNEVSGEEAKALVKAGAKIAAEGSNMVGFPNLVK